MPSFDIVSQVDMQEVDNAVNNTLKEATARYDFKGSNPSIELNRKDGVLRVEASDEMKLNALREMLVTSFVRRKVDPKCLEFGEPDNAAGGRVKMEASIQQGISKETAQKIVKRIKALKLKAQPAIQDDQVRVTAKKIDDLQVVIQTLNEEDFGLPLQFINMKR